MSKSGRPRTRPRKRTKPVLEVARLLSVPTIPGHGFRALELHGHIRCERCGFGAAGGCAEYDPKSADPCPVLPRMQREWREALTPGGADTDPMREALVDQVVTIHALCVVARMWLSVAQPLWRLKNGVIKAQPTLTKEFPRWMRQEREAISALTQYDRAQGAGAGKIDYAQALAADFEDAEPGEE